MTGTDLLDAVASFDAYRGRRGGVAIKTARTLGREMLVRELERSGLRGRDHAARAVGARWRGARASAVERGVRRRHVVANALDAEPGSHKHHALLRANPYRVVEGLLVAAAATDATAAFVAVPATAADLHDRVRRAVTEMSAAGLIDVPFAIVPCLDHQVGGDDRALGAAVEGDLPLPNVAPAGTVTATVVEDAETLAHVANIVTKGADWFRERGTVRSPGTMLCTVSGDVARAMVRELPLGTPLHVLVEQLAGGTASRRPVKLVMPGVTNGAVPARLLATPLDVDAFAEIGSALGAGGFVVHGDDVCALSVARAYAAHLWVESCEQCAACKPGTGALATALALLERRGDIEQFAVLPRALASLTDGARCALPASARTVVASLLRRFPADVAAHAERRCRLRHDVAVPRIVELAGGRARYDRALARKHPGWARALLMPATFPPSPMWERARSTADPGDPGERATQWAGARSEANAAGGPAAV
jgi:NADH-quinone oxidoreductase subunit F